MDLLSEIIKILLTISNALLYPVLIALVGLVVVSLISVGGLLSEYSGRSSKFDEKFHGGHLSGFYKKLNRLFKNPSPQNEKMLTAKIEKLLQDEENKREKGLERTRLLVRLGPMLGLMGTLIPLGPALVGLSTGNIEQLANNMVVAFTSTVVGLFVGGIALVVATIRRRWYLEDLRDMEYMAEIKMEKNLGEVRKRAEKPDL